MKLIQMRARGFRESAPNGFVPGLFAGVLDSSCRSAPAFSRTNHLARPLSACAYGQSAPSLISRSLLAIRLHTAQEMRRRCHSRIPLRNEMWSFHPYEHPTLLRKRGLTHGSSNMREGVKLSLILTSQVKSIWLCYC